MGVKSTVYLTYDDAVSKAADLLMNIRREEFEAKFRTMAKSELEDALEEMNDSLNDGEGFENYRIRSESN